VLRAGSPTLPAPAPAGRSKRAPRSQATASISSYTRVSCVIPLATTEATGLKRKRCSARSRTASLTRIVVRYSLFRPHFGYIYILHWEKLYDRDLQTARSQSASLSERRADQAREQLAQQPARRSTHALGLGCRTLIGGGEQNRPVKPSDGGRGSSLAEYPHGAFLVRHVGSDFQYNRHQFGDAAQRGIVLNVVDVGNINGFVWLIAVVVSEVTPLTYARQFTVAQNSAISPLKEW
jgi:hypothetical protein